MELTGEYLVPATREKVWQALNDPAVLKACIAGCQDLTRTSESSFDAVVVARVGPVAPTFRGTVELRDVDPPNGYTLAGRGQGGAAGFASMTAQVKLQPDGDATLLRYSATAEVGGKLAAVGSRLIQGVARKTADDFFAQFARHFDPSRQPAETGETSTPEAPVARPSPPAATAVPMAGGLGAPVPAWLVLFCAGLGVALGFCLGLLQR